MRYRAEIRVVDGRKMFPAASTSRVSKQLYGLNAKTCLVRNLLVSSLRRTFLSTSSN